MIIFKHMHSITQMFEDIVREWGDEEEEQGFLSW